MKALHALLLLAAASVAVAAHPCIWVAPNGKTYDLTPLMRVGSSYAGRETAQVTYALNFCTKSVTNSCSAISGQEDPMGIEIISGQCNGIVSSEAQPSFRFKNG
eukprot:TRINITY_DN2790_c0_g1_i2.p1 TRINITY_DN2790_c0_g1~~TRINITY_DN2790_c0_g1_i2.p1  ORF type:complete len:104 (+),score=20.82 TRINITY_DN2790_c0_g1_i2:75-386(+)